MNSFFNQESKSEGGPGEGGGVLVIVLINIGKKNLFCGERGEGWYK